LGFGFDWTRGILNDAPRLATMDCRAALAMTGLGVFKEFYVAIGFSSI
jgi:hypothetical protein